jgi:hypothetical protein
MDVVDLTAARRNAAEQRSRRKVRADAGSHRERWSPAIILLDDRTDVARLGDAGTCNRGRKTVEHVPGQRIEYAGGKCADVEAGDETR